MTRCSWQDATRCGGYPAGVTSCLLTDQPIATVDADVLVLGVVPDETGAALAAGHRLPRKAATHLTDVLGALEASGRLDDVHTVALVPGVNARKVVLTGLAPKHKREGSTVSPDTIRAGAGAALRAVTSADTVLMALPTGDAARLAAAIEGALLGSYAYTAQKSAKPESSAKPKRGRAQAADPGKVAKILVHAADAGDKDAKDTVTRAETLAAATAYARDLVNCPPNLLYPQSFVDSVTARVGASKAKARIQIVVHDEEQLAGLGCGGIVGVGQGSSRPPRIMELHYKPRGKAAGSLAYIGKGITFDTGGVCLKPPASMLTMKCDMAGAAAVAASVIAAAEMGLPVAVSGYLCLAENMPGGNAQRPGDIVTMRSGTTVEIIDTDAEGRMVLADGLALAGEKKPDALVDVATLTGACMIALGNKVAGLMSNDDDFGARVLASADEAGEPMWPLPLPDDLRAKLESPIADLQHKGDQYGGALTAGLFLREFAKDADGAEIPWAHLDIAGPAYLTDAPFGHVVKGGTGYAVATLVALAAGWAAK